MPNSQELLFKVFQKILTQEIQSRLTVEVLQELEGVQEFYANFPARIAKERDLRETVDGLCISYALDMQPSIPAELEPRIFFYDRFVFAKEFATSLRGNCIASPAKIETEITQWLLVDCWREYGVVLWRTSLLTPDDAGGSGML